MAFYKRYVKGIKEPPKEETDFGSALHTHLEYRVTNDLHIKPEIEKSYNENVLLLEDFTKMAQKNGMLPVLKDSGNIPVIAEKVTNVAFENDKFHKHVASINIEFDVANLDINIHSLGYDVKVIGAIDMLMFHNEESPYKLSVIDHKTKKRYDSRYLYTPETIIDDEQLLFYVAVISRALGLDKEDNVRVGHNYFFRKDRTTAMVSGVITVGRAYDYFDNHVTRVVDSMIRDILLVEESEVKGNPNMCPAYGGCHYASDCKIYDFFTGKK
jgi:hypothetical protein